MVNPGNIKKRITVIPALDIIDGKCVRLSKGAYDRKKVYGSDPLEMAKRFEQAGLKRLHVVDLDGAREGRLVNRATLEKIAGGTGLEIDFGGGLRSDDDINNAFACGVRQITAGSIAIHKPEKVQSWLQKYGAEKIILGADVRNMKIAVHGWQKQTAIELLPFLKNYFSAGLRTVICTDIERDGMLGGPALDLYAKIRQTLPALKIIASGGVGSLEDVIRLEEAGIDAVIIGKALYEHTISLKDLERFLC